MINNNDKVTNSELLIYLVRNGYLDENYHLYISNFHEGRLTKNDRDFLLTIRNFNPPQANQKIDTPKEICANMREEDFGCEYVLNVNLIDYLLEKLESSSSEHIESAMGYISQNFKKSEEFFTAYFLAGKHIADFIFNLSKQWSGLAIAAISSKHEAELISSIIRFVDANYISENMNTGEQLTDYLSKHGLLIFASYLPLPENYNVLKLLNVRFLNLLSLERNKAVLEFAHTECLYAITSDNVNYVLQKFAVPQPFDTFNPEKANYTAILAVGSQYLKKYIEENLPYYIERVFLNLPDNSAESEDAIKTLINHEMIDNELSKRIISRQNHVFNTFEGIPDNLWSHLLLEEKIIISWKNISEYLNSINYEDNDKVVTELLHRQKIVDSFSGSSISSEELGDDKSFNLSCFVLHNDVISDADYCKLINCLPSSFKSFPSEISIEKIKYLAKSGTVTLTEQSFAFVSDDEQLTTILINKNFDTYLEEKDKYSISDDIRELLLSSEINNDDKIIICLDVTPSGVINNARLSCLIANVLISNEIDYSEIDDSVLGSAIINAEKTPESIQLLMKCLSKWDEKKTMDVLSALPEPFSEISQYGKHPKLEHNEQNLALAKVLKDKGFISSIKEKNDSIIINTFTSIDHAEEND